MPNLYFTRDPFAVVGEGVNLNRMYSVTRNRETLYGKYVFKYHPDYKDVSLYFRRDCQFHTEGGDVLNINEKTLAVGISQRTQPPRSTSWPEHLLELRLQGRAHPGLRHPGLARLHAPRHGLHPDRRR